MQIDAACEGIANTRSAVCEESEPHERHCPKAVPLDRPKATNETKAGASASFSDQRPCAGTPDSDP